MGRFLLILFTLTLVFSISTFAQNPIDVSNTHEILISSVRRSDRFRDQKGDEALLIKDKATIAKLVSLFHKNIQHQVHACGYHWRLTFFRGDSVPTEIYFNEECEEFDRNTPAICEIVQEQFRRTVKRPNSYLINLNIDVNASPESAKESLTTNGHRVMSFMDINRLPYVEIQASSTSPIPDSRSLWETQKNKTVEEADSVLRSDISRIQKRYKIVETGQMSDSMSMFGGGQITQQRRVKVYFDVGTDLANVEAILVGSSIRTKSIPEVYILQVLTGSRLTPSDIRTLQKNVPYVKGVAPH